MMKQKRRKGKKRPATVGKNCKWLVYEYGNPKCGWKIEENNNCEDLIKRIHQDVNCYKCKNCGFEEKNNSEPVVSKMKKMLEIKKEIEDLHARLNKLEKMIENEKENN